MRPHRLVTQVVAGLIVLVVLALPAIGIWLAGSNGSLGDLGEIELLGVGLAIAVAAAAAAGMLMGRALDLVAAAPAAGRLDAWAAFFVAVAVLGSTVTLLPAITLVLLLPDENSPLGSRVHWIAVVWVLGGAVVAALSLLAGRAVLRRAS